MPEPGAFEVIVRVMAAGVNYNNVWAALGEPVGVWRYGDHPEYGHHIGGSDASGVVWKVGAGRHALEARRRGRHPLQPWPPTRTRRCTASTRSPRPSQKIWGYETTWGSFAQFTKVQAQQLLPSPQNLTWEEAASYGLVYFTAYRMLITQCDLQAGQSVLIWGAAGGLGVFATQLCAIAGAHAVGVVSSPEKGELVKQLGAVDYIDRNEFAGMMRTGGETPDEEKERFKVSRAFGKRVKEILGDSARHRVRARRPGHLPHLGVRGQAVRQGRDLRRHHRLQPRLRRALPVDAPEADPRLALRQRLRVHQGQRADRVGPDPPGAVAHAGLRRRARGAPADARQPAPRARSRSWSAPRTRARARPPRARARSTRRWARDRRVTSSGRPTRSGATSSPRAGCPAAEAVLDYGATAWAFYRAHDGRLDFIQTAVFPTKAALRALLVLRADRREARRAGRLPTRCRCCRRSRRSWARARHSHRQPYALSPLERRHRQPAPARAAPSSARPARAARSRRSPGRCCGSGWPSPCPAS